ncbi:MAG: FlaA1/EpsC-like NDP-sugar epimerase [Dokdonia sp.]|jgi:FlaA1/EpsC-like NDP-sugar epimerase
MNANAEYDYALNLSALKYVSSEEDPFTLMRLIGVVILNTIKTAEMANAQGAKKYFCMSTVKAANPVNMIGASKRIMEMFLMRESESMGISIARFANVVFSDGSLLYGFNQQFAKRQPIPAPNDARRYFLTPQESGELCLMPCLLDENRDIFFIKLSEQFNLTTFSDFAKRYIKDLACALYHCLTAQKARDRSDELIAVKRWSFYVFKSGEKYFEEFFTNNEILDVDRFQNLGAIKNKAKFSSDMLDDCLEATHDLRAQTVWEKAPIVGPFTEMIPDFDHKETGKYLDGRT